MTVFSIGTSSTSIIQMIQAIRPSLGVAAQKVAAFSLSHPEEVIYLSVTEMAAKVGVSEATVIRFCQQLNLKGYQDFKIQLSQAILTPVKTLNQEIELTDGPLDLMRKISQTMTRTLDDTLQITDENQLKRAIQTLASATRVEFIGCGGSGIIAHDAYHKFMKLGIPCGVHRDAHNAAQVCSLLTPTDVVVAISYSGTTRDILRSVELAKEAGATIIALTRLSKTPLSKLADIVLFSSSPESRYRSEGVSSRVAQLCLIDTLTVGIFISNEKRFGDALRRSRSAITDARL